MSLDVPKLRRGPLCPTPAAARTPIDAAYPCGFSMQDSFSDSPNHF